MVSLKPSTTEYSVRKYEIDVGVIHMRDELERVRDWATGQIRIGNKAPASWDQYVTLIESADALLHEIAIAANLLASTSITCPGTDHESAPLRLRLTGPPLERLAI